MLGSFCKTEIGFLTVSFLDFLNLQLTVSLQHQNHINVSCDFKCCRYVHMLCFTSSNPCCCCGNHLFAASFFLQVIVHVVHLAVLMIQQCFLKFIVHGTLRGVLTRKTSQYAAIITCRADPGVGCRGCISQKTCFFILWLFIILVGLTQGWPTCGACAIRGALAT